MATDQYTAQEIQHRRRSSSDPLAHALKPPQGESPQQRDERLRSEAKAKKVSDAIDEQIKHDRAALKKRKEVKILLLGQSESGKSTTLKQFQILHTPSQFHAERVAWRAVIYLNLSRSIRRILQALDAEDSDDETSSVTSHSFSIGSKSSLSKLQELDALKARLSPIRALEEDLIRKLAASDETEATRLVPTPSSLTNGDSHNGVAVNGTKHGKDNKEMTVRTTNNWKKAFFKNNNRHPTAEGQFNWWDDPNDPVHLLNACAEDMSTLWKHPVVKETLKRRRIRLQESSGFFLDEIDRITDKRYVPTEDDVLKARLKTLGVVEHCFTLDRGNEKGVDWKIFDVGGARSQRQYWAPYFSDVDAIIFLAPISAFDQVLAEDTAVNRMEDSLVVWRTVISNKLLENVNIVLFLNKCDLLEYKLDHGVKLKTHMTSYGDRPNNYETICKYFKNKFQALHQSFSNNQQRDVYIHFTSVTDTRKTSSIIANVRDIILRKNLEGSRLI